MTRTVVVTGGTGEVGRRLLARLAGRPDLEVAALVRRPGLPVRALNLRELPFDFAALTLEPGQRRVLEGLDLHPGSVSNWGKV